MSESGKRNTASKEDMASTEGSTQAAPSTEDPPELDDFASFCQMQFRLLDGTTVSRYFCPFGTSEKASDSCALLDNTKARTHFAPPWRKPSKKTNKKKAPNPNEDRERFIEWLTSDSDGEWSLSSH